MIKNFRKYFVRVLVFLCLIYPDFASSQEASGKSYFPGQNKTSVLAYVDTLKITAEEFLLSYEYGPAFIKKAPDSKEKHLEYMINEKLLALDGLARGIDKSEETNSVINDFADDIATEQLFRDSILSQIKPDESVIQKIIKDKLTIIDIKWLYSNDETQIKYFHSLLGKGDSFDSLFLTQINQSVPVSDRSMTSSIYQLESKNSELASIIKNLKLNEYSSPVRQNDGWYILRIGNLRQDQITTESEYVRLYQEAVNAFSKREMDSLSDVFVNKLMLNNNPVIKRDAFRFVRSYIGIYYLPEEKYTEWEFDKIMNETLADNNGDMNDKVLITLSGRQITIAQFLGWYRNRNQYIKLNKTSFADFSVSLEKLIWRMTRDYLLADLADEYGYYQHPEVVKQIAWWKDKITGSAVRNEIANSIFIENGEGVGNERNEDIKSEFQKRMLHKILGLKQKYTVKINSAELTQVPVSVENDIRAVEFLSVKNGGLIPRTPYPTINHEWVNWE